MADSAPSRATSVKANGGSARHDRPLPIAARRHPLVAEVRRRLLRYVNVSGRARIVVGVSGGPDSVALLLALLAIREQQSAEITPEPIIAHVNHHLRDDAEHDAAFVRSLGERFGVPVTVEDIHPAGTDENLAATARAMRYQALVSVARRHDARHTAVAHHAEDQFESMVMAFCRGAGLEGISAMAWSRPMTDFGESEISLTRPLLASRKSECESLCAAAGITWRTDESNRDLSRTRNRLRYEVMPLLEACWPEAPVRAAMTADLLRESTVLLEEKLAERFGPASQHEWIRHELKKLSPVLIAAGLRRAAKAALAGDDRPCDDALTQRVLLPAAEAIVDDEPSPRQFTLVPGLTLEVRAQVVKLQSIRR